MAGRRRIIDDPDSSDSEVMIVDNVDNNNNVGSKDKKANSTTRTTAPPQQQQAIHPQLQQKICTEAGVQPSNYWLEKCLSHLRRKVRVSIVVSCEFNCSI